MSETKFSVTWDSYQKNICNGLSCLQQKGEFVDMTIAADGHLVRVHQMVMSLISPYIKELISSAECPQPVIYLNRVSYQTLQFILEYAYTGEVLVPQQGLEQFLQVCNDLHIKGLENMGKTITETNNDDSYKIDEINKSMENNEGATIGLSHLSYEADGNVCTDIEDFDVTPDHEIQIQTEDFDDASDHDTIREDDSRKKDHSHSMPKLDPAKSKLQYSVSAQGSPQLILNRYIYVLRYTRKDNSKTWRCYHYNHKGCQASAVTKGDKAIQRIGVHNHGYHDAQILKRVKNRNVFTIEPKKHDLVAKRLCNKADIARKLLQ